MKFLFNLKASANYRQGERKLVLKFKKSLNSRSIMIQNEGSRMAEVIHKINWQWN